VAARAGQRPQQRGQIHLAARRVTATVPAPSYCAVRRRFADRV